jgi:hypothetical protein
MFEYEGPGLAGTAYRPTEGTAWANSPPPGTNIAERSDSVDQSYISRLVGVGHDTLPMILKHRPLMYWHFKTTLILAMEGDFSAATELAELMVELIEDKLESCIQMGDVSGAKALESARDNILEGIKS